jgi:hypothetical protein
MVDRVGNLSQNGSHAREAGGHLREVVVISIILRNTNNGTSIQQSKDDWPNARRRLATLVTTDGIGGGAVGEAAGAAFGNLELEIPFGRKLAEGCSRRVQLCAIVTQEDTTVLTRVYTGLGAGGRLAAAAETVGRSRRHVGAEERRDDEQERCGKNEPQISL